MSILVLEVYTITILLIFTITLVLIFETKNEKIIHKITFFSIIFIFIILIYSFLIRIKSNTYSHQFLHLTSQSISYWSEIECKSSLNKLIIKPSTPFKPNVNPSYFSILYLEYKTDSKGYVITSPNISFLGLVLSNWTQVYSSPIKNDTIERYSKFTIIVEPLNSNFRAKIGFDFTIKTNGRIDIKRYKVQNKYL